MKKIFITRKLLKENEDKLKKLFDVRLNSNDKIYSTQEIIDGSKDCDLVNNVDDAIASAANYLKMHKWEKGQKVAIPVNKIAKDISSSQLYTKPKNTIEYYRDKGYLVEGQIQTDLVSLIELDNEISKEYWMGFHNFYVITRYNHSPLYAMAVHQLAQAIRTLRN